MLPVITLGCCILWKAVSHSLFSDLVTKKPVTCSEGFIPAVNANILTDSYTSS
jgi:hypothetical protein